MWLEGSAQSALQRYYNIRSCLHCDLLLTLHLVHVAFLDVIKEKGLEHVTVEDLVTVITPKGRGIGCFKICCLF